MAGDWIKVEHSTLEKPEVALFAELLGLKVDEGIGILVRFWVWANRNSCNGLVTHVTRGSLETIMHCTGFAAAIERVGWAKFDDEDHKIALPHFDRHNGSSAKSRALANERVKRFRNGNVTPVNGSGNGASVTNALPEKRREVLHAPTAKNAVASGDPLKTIFDVGISMLVAAGTSEPSSRSFLAKQVKDYGEAAVGTVVAYLAANPKVEPRAYIVSSLRPETEAERHRKILESLP